MATMKTLNGYGFNATEFNGKTSDSYLQKTDTASDTSKLGGKAPEYYIQPRNLLDNSDFRNPVNQRGNSEYLFNFGYSLDRWRLCGGDAISRVRVLSGCIEVSLNDDKSYFDQLINVDKTKTYTFAVLADDGLHIISGIPSVGANDEVILLGVDSAGYVKASIVGFLRIYNIYWAALYEGSYTADTLPPYVPKGHAVELAACNSAPVDLGGGCGGGSLQAYPVGAVYISANSTSPASLFGGTWESIGGRFLLGADATYAAGSTGGEETHTLTIDEMPAHRHIIYMKGESNNGDFWGPNAITPQNKTIANSTDTTGGNHPHNNMPPYLAVYMWKRVS